MRLTLALLRMDVGDAGGAGSKDGRREMSKKTTVTKQVRDDGGSVQGNRC